MSTEFFWSDDETDTPLFTRFSAGRLPAADVAVVGIQFGSPEQAVEVIAQIVAGSVSGRVLVNEYGRRLSAQEALLMIAACRCTFWSDAVGGDASDTAHRALPDVYGRP